MTDYPKTMVHPHAQKGTSRPIPGTGKIVGGREVNPDYQGTPDRLAPLYVENAEQEEAARARGYLASGEAPAPSVEYAEYPLMMRHPEHVDAVPDEMAAEKDDKGQVRTFVIKGTPARMPDVQVSTADDEAAWGKKGYRRMGVADPVAVEQARCSPHVPGRVTNEYPKMVDGVLVQDPSLSASGPVEFPKWLRHPTEGGIEPVLVNDLAGQTAQLAKWGIVIAPVAAAPSEPRPVLTMNLVTPVVQEALEPAVEPPTLTRGEKAAATRAANKAKKLEEAAA